MKIKKVNENVDYYVINSIESEELFDFTEDSKVKNIALPSFIKPLKDEYVFVYVGPMRAHPNHDYKLTEYGIEFVNPMSAAEQIIVKIYTRHDINVEDAETYV